MANHKSAKKRNKQSLVRQERNKAQKSTMKTAVKNLKVAIKGKDKELAATLLKSAQGLLAKLAKKNVIAWQNAARRTSRLSSQVSKI